MPEKRLTVPQIHECRPEVLNFARLMEYKLRKNDHKAGWKQTVDGETRYFPPMDAYRRLLQEAGEVANELIPPDRKCGCREACCPHSSPWWRPDPAKTGCETADVANFAMMIADACGALDMLEPPLSPSPSPAFHPAEIATVEKAITEALAELDKLGQPHAIGCQLACAWGILKGRLQQQHTQTTPSPSTLAGRLSSLVEKVADWEPALLEQMREKDSVVASMRSIVQELSRAPTGVPQENGGDTQS